MKIKNYFLLLALGLCLSFSMTACSDDDDEVTTEDEQEQTDPEETTTVTSEVAGTYSGYVDVLFSYITNPYAYPEETLTITAADDTTVDVAYENELWGTYAISGATVTDNGDGTYTIEGSGTATISYHGSTATDYECTVTATIADGSSELVFSVPDVMGGTTVNFHEGDAPASYYAYGDYEGYTEVLFVWITTPMGYGNETVSFAINADDYSLVDISYENDTWGTYAVTGATATDNGDGTYSIEGSGTATISYHGSSASEYDCTVTATISEGSTTVEFSVPDVMQGTTVSFYEGDSPAAYIAQGDYEGALAISAYGVNVGSVAETVTIEATGHEEATVTLPAFDISVAAMGMTMSLGDMDITGVTVTSDDNETCTLSASNVSFTATLNNTEMSATATISGSVTNGDEQSGEIEFSFTLGSMAITAVFTVGATVEDDTDTDTDTDTETGTAGGATDIEGTYSGTVTLSASGYPLGSSDDTLIIESIDDATANITLSSFSISVTGMGDFELGAIVIPNVAVSILSDGTYSVSTDSIDVSVDYNSYTTSVTGSLSGTISSDKSSLDLTFDLVFDETPLTATFTK